MPEIRHCLHITVSAVCSHVPGEDTFSLLRTAGGNCASSHLHTAGKKKRYLILPHIVFELNKSPLKFVMRNTEHLIKQCLKCRIYISQKNFNKNIVAIEQCKNSAEKYYSSLNARGIFHKRDFPLKQKALS